MFNKAFTALAGIGLSVALTGCGFQPLYGEKGGDTRASEQMKDVYVANIGGGRFGQVFRLDLQSDLGSDAAQPNGYILRANANMNMSAINIHPNNTSGRTQLVAVAQWQLFKVGPKNKLVTQGTTRTLDGLDMTIDEYFGQTLNMESIQERVAHTLADQITQQLAAWFKEGIPASMPVQEATPQYVDPDSLQNDQGVARQNMGADGVPSAATGRVGGSFSTQSPE